MPDADDPGDDLLVRYIADECTAAERQQVDAWLARREENARRVQALRRIWGASRPAPMRDVDRMWTQVRAAMGAAPRVDRSAHTARPALERPARRTGLGQFSRREFPAGAWAAALVALVGGALLVQRASPRAPVAPLAAPPHAYATGRAQAVQLRLRDGSRVTLAPESRLLVPDDYGHHARVVTLEGQGFFDVVHNAAQPFRVLAKGAVAQDLGTRFDLRAYADERGVVVIVADGAVTLGRARDDRAVGDARGRTQGRTAGGASGGTQAGAEGVVVRRGERGRLSGADGTTTVDHVPLRVVAWTSGRLAFVQTPLPEIARAIGRWSHLDVRVDAALVGRAVTADFRTQTPREMVAVLATAVDGVVEQQGGVLTIRPRP